MADTPFENPKMYDVNEQLIPFYWQRKALIDERPKMYFGRLADTTTMP